MRTPADVPSTPQDSIATEPGEPVQAADAEAPEALPSEGVAAVVSDPSTPSAATAQADLSNFSELVALVQSKDEGRTRQEIGRHLRKLEVAHGMDDYTVLYLMETSQSIAAHHANTIYDAAVGKKGKPILLVVSSDGGEIGSAYLIGKTCKGLSNGQFKVAVPRRAKSAATLIALGATEIHMGLMSELGPIDPQIGGYPALGLMHAINKISQLANEFPGSADMWSNYLTGNLNLTHLGWSDRVTESASQYAERLLRGKTFPNNRTVESIASHFVNHYKDHSFVIDHDEAVTILGTAMIKTDTSEYHFGNAVFNFFNGLSILFSVFRQMDFGLVGTDDIRTRPEQGTPSI